MKKTQLLISDLTGAKMTEYQVLSHMLAHGSRADIYRATKDIPEEIIFKNNEFITGK